MIRNSIVRASRQAVRSSRLFSTSQRSMADGDAGAPRTGGTTQSDAFTKREQASENQYVREQEMNKLKLLRQKLKSQQENISDLQKDIDTMINETEKSPK